MRLRHASYLLWAPFIGNFLVIGKRFTFVHDQKTLNASSSPVLYASYKQASDVKEIPNHSSDDLQSEPQLKSANHMDKSSDSMAASQHASTHLLRQVTQSLSSAVGSVGSTMVVVSLIPQSLLQRSEMYAHSTDMMEFLFKLAIGFAALIAILCSFCGMKKAKHACENFNIREWCGIGAFLRATGYDKYDTFSLSLIVNKNVYLATSPIAVRISTGSNSVTTEAAELGSEAKGIKQSLNIEVPQGASTLLVEFVDPKKRGSSAVLGSKKLSIEQVLSFADTGEAQTITVKLKSKSAQMDPRVEITFCALDHGEDFGEGGILSDVDDKALSPEMQMLLQQQHNDTAKKAAKRKSSKRRKNESSTGDDDDESKESGQSAEEEQPHSLDLIAGTCTGKLSMSKNFGGQQIVHCAVFQCAKDGIPRRFPPSSKRFLASWHFGWWKDQRLVAKEEPPSGKIPMLRVTNVQVCKDKENDFCIRYLNAEKAHEHLYLTHTQASDSRSRAVWVESLHLFVEQCHKSAKGLQ